MKIDKSRERQMAMRIAVIVVMMCGVGTAVGEVGCFRSAAEAAAQAGVRDDGGFRLEGWRKDVFGGRMWATVRSCLHPEWPLVVVAGAKEDGRPAAVAHLSDDEAVAKMGHPIVMRGGAVVRVVQREARVRVEMAGVAQASGRLGDSVWVRLAGMNGADGRIVLAVVRGADVLEVTQ